MLQTADQSGSGFFLLALVALFFGGIFFLYALKYYFGMAIILIANGNGAGNGNGNGNGFNGLARNGGNGHNGYRPFVSIHLPLYNEAKVVDRLLQAATSLNYENYEVIVADDSTDQTTAILQQRWGSHPRIRISHRRDRSGFKGGALQQALQISNPQAEFIAVFDADFIPPPDILQQFLSYFFNGNGHNGHEPGHSPRLVDDRLAAVQGYQWHILNASENWITKGIRTEYAGSYVIERSVQEILGSMKMIAGSVFMIRADVLRQHGWGTSITEDWELTLRLYLSGYKVLYTPFIQAPSECVASFKQLARQRMRWAEGHTYNVKKYFTQILSSTNISISEKLEFLYYAPYYLQSICFVLGTGAWLISELLLKYRLPMVPAALGWAFVLTNMLSLVMMNLTGLFMERGVRHNWSGLLSFVLLTYLLVPYQAFAALKALLEPHEGGWHRTQKTGVITDMVARLGLGRRMSKVLPKHKKRRKVDLGRRLGRALPGAAKILPTPLLRYSRRLSPGMRVASLLAAALLILAILASGISIVSAAPDAFYLHDNPLNDGRDMSIVPGSGLASLVFDSPGQTASWYTEEIYPTGGEDAVLAGGAYSLHLYFDQLPGSWWDDNYTYRRQVTVSTDAAIDPYYSVSLTFNHAAMVGAGKSLPSGNDVRLAYWDGSNWYQLDRVVDPLSDWDRSNTKIWFAAREYIPGSSFDSNYYLYYGNSSAGSPPQDLTSVFQLADTFNDGALSSDLGTSTNAGYTVEEIGGELVLSGSSTDPGAAIVYGDSSLPFSREFAIRHMTKVVSGGTGSGSDPEFRLLGIVEGLDEPIVRDASEEDPLRRIMVSYVTDTEEMRIYYFDSAGDPQYWDGSGWSSGIGSWTTLPLDTYSIIEMESDGQFWWVRVLDDSGSQLTESGIIPWTDVYNDGDDFWWYWGEVYTDQYWGEQRSDWVYMRDYAYMEPTATIGSESRVPTVDISIEVHHTAADGSDPQWIAAGSATIFAGTADPLIVDLGTGVEQIFQHTDPRRIRVRITVDDTNGGGSFTLAYDSAVELSRLETPSLTVFEPSLILGLVALLIPLVTGFASGRRRVATRLIAGLIALVVSLALLAGQISVVSAAPDVLYLNSTATSAITPAGELMDSSEGSSGSTILFDTQDQTAYWYSASSLPEGLDDASIVAGDYQLNLYFSQVPAAGSSVEVIATVSHTDIDGSSPATIVTSSATTIDESTPTHLILEVGNDGIGQSFSNADPQLLRVQLSLVTIANNGSFTLIYGGSCASDQCSNLNTPVITVPEYGLAFALLIPLLPTLAAALAARRRRVGSQLDLGEVGRDGRGAAPVAARPASKRSWAWRR